jgi:hypothetical protein
VKRLSILFVLLLFAVAAPVSAAPKGDARDPDVGKKLYQFNVIAVPNSWTADDTTCPNNGSRIFFQQSGSNTLGRIDWSLDPTASQDFNITDCNGTNDGTGAVTANELLNFYVMIKLVGPKTSTLDVVCTWVLNQGPNDLCLYSGGITRNSTTKIFQNVADNQYEGVLWTWSGNWKVFQVLIYEKL